MHREKLTIQPGTTLEAATRLAPRRGSSQRTIAPSAAEVNPPQSSAVVPGHPRAMRPGTTPRPSGGLPFRIVDTPAELKAYLSPDPGARVIHTAVLSRSGARPRRPVRATAQKATRSAGRTAPRGKADARPAAAHPSTPGKVSSRQIRRTPSAKPSRSTAPAGATARSNQPQTQTAAP